MSPAMAARLGRSRTLADELWTEVELLELSAETRSRMAGACFGIALTHHLGIIELLERGLSPSASALLRPQIDSYVRGLWLSHSATDEQIQGIQAGNDPPDTRKIAAQLEREQVLDAGHLSGVTDTIWGAVCDFTHTGIRQMARFMTETSLEPNLPHEEIEELLGASDAWSLLAAVGIAGLCKDDELANRLLVRARALSGT